MDTLLDIYYRIRSCNMENAEDISQQAIWLSLEYAGGNASYAAKMGKVLRKIQFSDGKSYKARNNWDREVFSSDDLVHLQRTYTTKNDARERLAQVPKWLMDAHVNEGLSLQRGHDCGHSPARLIWRKNRASCLDCEAARQRRWKQQRKAREYEQKIV